MIMNSFFCFFRPDKSTSKWLANLPTICHWYRFVRAHQNRGTSGIFQRNPTPYTLFFLFLCLVLAVGVFQQCSPTPKQKKAYYYWRTNLTISDAALDSLHRLAVERMYIRVFDVDLDTRGFPAPQGVLTGSWPTEKTNIACVPVVFITNRTLKNRTKEELDTLSNRIWQKVDDVCSGVGFKVSGCREIQLDCDWSRGTKGAFFYLVEQLRARANAQNMLLSATIRMHQVLYVEQTGVPPADRGMLMAYNVGSVDDWEEENSILSMKKLMPYTKRLRDYPLPLDMALPRYDWAVLFRGGEMIRLLHKPALAPLQDSSLFTRLAPNRYEAVSNFYYQGQYLYRDDRIRYETISPALLDSCKMLLEKEWPRKNGEYHVSLFHWGM